jgi:hypothetical protein
MPAIAIIPLVLTIISWIVQVILAAAVLIDDAPRRVLVGKSVWALATLAGGVFVAAAYWLLHHGLPQTAAPRVAPREQGMS